jgi:hypothetical protein
MNIIRRSLAYQSLACRSRAYPTLACRSLSYQSLAYPTLACRSLSYQSQAYQSQAYPTLFNEIINTYDENNEENDHTKHMSARQLYNYRLKNIRTGFSGNAILYDVYKAIYERDVARERKP